MRVKKYIGATKKLLWSCKPKPLTQNLSLAEFQALQNLKHNPNIIITKADKGDTIVVLEIDYYTTLAYKHLLDPTTYKRLTGDPTPSIADRFNVWINTLLKAGAIDQTTHKFLSLPPRIVTQHIYFLPKLHKNPINVRPIVACRGGPTETASALLDRFLQPLAQSVKSYVRNSADFVRKIEQTALPHDCLLVTLDVASLYTNISHEDACQTISQAFANNPTPYLPPLPIVIQLLQFVLKNNVFSFNGEYYLQLHGIAMGTKLAPALATLYLGLIEEEFLTHRVFKPKIWLRYIDDIFLIWTEGRQALDTFIEDLNTLKPRIKFTADISDTHATFLDVKVFKGNRFTNSSLLDTSISYKPTNNFLYIHGSSYHPQSTYKSIARGEALRILRCCSNEGDFRKNLTELIRHLRRRSFPRSAIKLAKAVDFKDRNAHLQGKTKENETRPTLFLSHKFAQLTPSLTQALNKYWLGIDSDPHLNKKFPCPPIVSNRNYRSLGRLISKKTIHNPECIPQTHHLPPHEPQLLPLPPPSRQNKLCSSMRCKVCPILTRAHCIRNIHTKVTYPIDTSLTCYTQGIIYALHCNTCHKQYIGQTGYNMKHRLAGHTYAFPRVKKSLYLHF